MSSAPLRISNVLGRLPPNLEQSPESGSPCLQVQGTKCRSCPEPPQTWGHGQKGVGMSTGVLMWLVALCTPGTAGLLWGAWKTEAGLLPGLNSWAGGRRGKKKRSADGLRPKSSFPRGFPHPPGPKRCWEQLGKGSERRVLAEGGGMLVLEQPAPRGRQLLAIYSVHREVPGRGFKSR